MATTINAAIAPLRSETSGAAPYAGNMQTGELAINLADKKLFVKNQSGDVVPVQIGDVTQFGAQEVRNKDIETSTINSTPIGQAMPSVGSFSTLTAQDITVANTITANSFTGTTIGNHAGTVNGTLQGNVTTTSGSSTFNDVTVLGTLNLFAGTAGTVTGLSAPTNDTDAATKKYVDDNISNLVGASSAALDTLEELGNALNDDANFATNVTNSIATKLPLSGGTMTGTIDMGGGRIVNVASPINTSDVATRGYADLKLPKTGGVLSGGLDLNNNKIINLGTPVNPADATTKSYVDSILGSATSAEISAAAAQTSALNAAISEANAADSETNAYNSAIACALYLNTTNTIYDNFDDRYLGPKASDPTLDNDGGALLTGALYFNTTTPIMRVYTGSVWQDVASGSGSTTLTIDQKTVDYTIVAGDNGKVIEFLNNSVCTLPSAATVGSGFNVWVWSSIGTGFLLIAPNGSETIDYQTSLTLGRNDGVQLVSNGTNWKIAAQRWTGGVSVNRSSGAIAASATGSGAIAVGHNTSAGATYSTAIGRSVSGGSTVPAGATYAVAIGGGYASGQYSFAANNNSTTSSYGSLGTFCISLGYWAKAAASASIAVGNLAWANGTGAISIGSNSLSSVGSVSLGYGASSGPTSIAIGSYAYSSTIGKIAFACGNFDSVAEGSSQAGIYIGRAETTNATATKLTGDGAAASNTNQFVLEDNSAYAFSGLIVARQQASAGTASAAWEVKGLVRREGSAATTVLVNSSMTVIDNTPGWTLTISADTTNGALSFTATGASATNIRWVLSLNTSEVTY